MNSTIALILRMFYGMAFCLMLSHVVVGQENRTNSTNRFISDASILPAKLKLEGDSIRFTIKGTIPIESVLIPRNPRLALTLYSSEGAIELGDLTLVKQIANFSYEKKFSIKYEPWMQGASLELEFFQGKKNLDQPEEKKIIARGIYAPQSLVRLGASDPEEPLFKFHGFFVLPPNQ